MKLVTTISGLVMILTPTRKQEKTIGLVPTMGNLHDGHIALIEKAKSMCDVVVASIFVNPTQFGEGEDFDKYPRTLEEDTKKLKAAGCDIVFAPTVADMYGNAPKLTTVNVADITTDLCGKSRPGHFTGVATVVTKLFNLVQPQHAFFGEKDYQQLSVISVLAADLCYPITIHAVPTVRTPEGLALSSRNGFLSPAELDSAPQLYQSMQLMATQIKAGEKNTDKLINLGKAHLKKHGFVVDYLAIRTPLLKDPTPTDKSWVILIAATLGKTRLIDNITVQL